MTRARARTHTRWPVRRATLAAALAAALAMGLVAGCGTPEAARWMPEVVSTHPHDANAFTQGLLFHDGRFYESTGRYGASDLREVAIDTGAVVRRRPLEARFFAEGLARVGDRLWQLSYREGIAFHYDLATFEELGRVAYAGEGWGLCYDGAALWMSDGSARLQRREPTTFAVLGHLDVRLDGEPVARLNELECVGEHVYANVWLSDRIVRVRTADGRVDAVIDASALVPDDPAVAGNADAVLNGIAHDAAGDRWWVTGKLWPLLYEVRWVPAP